MNEMRIVAPCFQLSFENTRCIVHRTALQTGKRQDYGMVGIATAKCLILCSARTLIAHEVRISAAQTCWTCCLVRIDHNLVLGSLFHCVKIVVVHSLTIVVVTAWDDIAHITALHGGIAIFVHQRVSLLHPTLIVGNT